MRKANRIILLGAMILMGTGLLTPISIQAHCQIPCGIYDDHMRLQSMLEDAATIEKSVKMMTSLAKKTDVQSQNQMVRWVMSKEDHAQKIIETISNYYLTQRVKPDQKDYAQRLQRHHVVILSAMQAKQTADLQTVTDLLKNIQGLSDYYPEHKH